MEWNLTDIFKNLEEYEITKKDFLNNLDKIESFRGKLCDLAENLYNCYKYYEKASEQYEKIYAYAMLKYHLDMANQESIKLFKDAESLGTVFSTKTSFISPEITYADEKIIRKYIEKPEFESYKRDITDILELKKHTLSQEAEDILANYQEVFSAPENTFDILTNAEFKFGNLIDENGEKVELTDSNYAIYLRSKNAKVRETAFKLMYKKYGEYINTITGLYLANIKTTGITSKLRNYKSSLDLAVTHDDASIKVYDALIEAINENITANYEYLKLKKKISNLEELHMYDLYLNPFEKEKDNISYEDAKKEVLNALQVLGAEYTNRLNVAFNNNWIDVMPKQNKMGGGYNMGVYGVHPYILLNFINSKRDVSTIAHELGHAMHTYYSNKNQNVINANYTIMVAEVASTVNEMLLAHYQIENEENKTKKAELLYELIEMLRATFFRQAMFAEFEKIAHEKVEKGEAISSDELNNIYYDLNKKYFGTDIVIDKEIQYEWARIPHFYSDFYVYKYATGISAAIMIATNIIKQGMPYVEKYIEMLKQGCSKKSIELLKMVDVDLESKETYINTINFYKEKVQELKDLI